MQSKSIILSLTVLFAACANAAPLGGTGSNNQGLANIPGSTLSDAAKQLGNPYSVLGPSINLHKSPNLEGNAAALSALSFIPGTLGASATGPNKGNGGGEAQDGQATD
jgi:hypothetical protein